MLNPRLIREQDATLHFEVMAWLVQNYGPPGKPPVPSPLHKSVGLESLVWAESDTRSIFDWTADHFTAIKYACQMDDVDTLLVPAGDRLESSQLIANQRLFALAAGRNPYVQPETEQTSSSKKDVIHFDPRDCMAPGYFSISTILQLANIRAAGFNSGSQYPALMSRMITLTTAAYMRQGFVLAKQLHKVSTYLTSDDDLRTVPQRIVINALCFSTCLALRVRRQSAEQIIATYGTRMSKIFRRKVKQACRQIDARSSDLSTLQLLANPKPVKAKQPYVLQQRA